MLSSSKLGLIDLLGLAHVCHQSESMECLILQRFYIAGVSGKQQLANFELDDVSSSDD